ncbi:phosphatase PAP2 family protein [Niveibacterium sp. 24ML]|uniref:phosphatase PAP2 family protein n=1 Tax=Niveibacterium sp. 24ML TaxID=2985512 RepID=UPI0022705640|nr:phosphatase PAP2 family protein [Niveibacterium sp. 24ML]MCX9155746.1 phosphatase PAP2 family protein [Niveibacterium sp. 24ML]
MILTAPAILVLGAAITCPAGECRAGAFDTGGLALAATAHGPLADAFFRAVTWAGSVLVLGPLALLHAAMHWRRQPSVAAFFVPGALAGAVLMAHAMKLALDRKRPALAALIDMPIDASFPSAHSLQIAAFITAWLVAPGRNAAPWRTPAMIAGTALVVLVAWSRLHLQVHFPSDILIGLIAGLAWPLTLRHLPTWSSAR